MSLAGLAPKVAWAAVGVNVFLWLLNAAVAYASGSVAVAAEMVHNLTDLVGSVAVLAGLKLSERQNRAFPYGLGKVENLTAVLVAGLVLLAAAELAHRAVVGQSTAPIVNGWVLAGVALSMVVPGAFSHYEMRLGTALRSPSLIAAAHEFRLHVFSSGLVLLALLGRVAGHSLERYAALIVVALVAKTGWELLVGGVRVLLDASLDRATIDQVTRLMLADPAVAEVRSLVGRDAGRYRFLEAEIALRVVDLARAHAVSQRLEAEIRKQVPGVQRVLIHYEPAPRERRCYAVPLADARGTICQHFGQARWFGLVTASARDSHITGQQILPNPFAEAESARGIRVAEWLVSLGIDAVLTREDVSGNGPAYVLAEAGVEICRTGATRIGEVSGADPAEEDV